MRLDNYGYRETKNSARGRRRALGRAIRALGYQETYNLLTDRKFMTRKRYRQERIDDDINWLIDRAEKTGVRLIL